jgi:hypothetical protein
LTGMNHNITDLGIPPESELRGIGIILGVLEYPKIMLTFRRELIHVLT